MTPAEARDALTRLLQTPEKDLDLAEAALLIAAEEYPELRPAVYLNQIARMGTELKQRIRAEVEPHRVVEKTIPVPNNSRVTTDIANAFNNPAYPGSLGANFEGFGTVIDSDQPIIVERPFWGPFYPYGYYPYPAPYMPTDFGEVKIDTHQKDAEVYIDGGYAAKIKETKKFALRPGNHEIELRDSDGRTL